MDVGKGGETEMQCCSVYRERGGGNGERGAGEEERVGRGESCNCPDRFRSKMRLCASSCAARDSRSARAHDTKSLFTLSTCSYDMRT